MGGMTKAVESGWAKMQVETCAADKQARIDSGKDVIVGVNKYKLAKEDPIEILNIDNHAGPRKAADRPPEADCARRATAPSGPGRPDALTECAETGQGNLLDLTVKAIRLRATVGEVSTRWKGLRSPSRQQSDHFFALEASGRTGQLGSSRPRSPVRLGRRPPAAHHDRQTGARTATTAAPRSWPRPSPTWASTSTWARSSRPREVARQAVETTCAIGCSSPGRRPQDPGAGTGSRPEGPGADDIIVFAGGVIPPRITTAVRAGAKASSARHRDRSGQECWKRSERPA